MRQGESEYIAFLDECGDHSLTRIDKDFPIFVLSLVLLKRSGYRDEVIPAFTDLKLRYWDHEGGNLHSRDIRKAHGPFAILQNATVRQPFLNELSELMRGLPYELFVVAIHKERLCSQYIHATNPYELALTFALERLIHCMEQRQLSALPLIAEARGKNEDNQLKVAFYDLTSQGTSYVHADQFQKHKFLLQFHDKRKNIAGIQLADLCAHPSARQIIKPEQPNRAFEVVRDHIYQRQGNVKGWKVFP